ncbi:MAG TPA: hypothetical protein VJ821_07385 [Anaerolineales bacterium]|nr:hypothetical protein [Anaerolineales bacterium]
MPLPSSKTCPRSAYSDEEEIRIVLEAMRGEENVAEMIETSGS